LIIVAAIARQGVEMRSTIITIAIAALLSAPAVCRADVLDEIGGGSSRRKSHVRDHQRFASSGETVSIQYREQLNFQPLLDRLYTLLTSEEWLGGKYPECEAAVKAAKEMGAFSLTSTLETLEVNGTDVVAHCSTYYSDLDPASERGKLMNLPNLAPVSAKYTPADSLFYFAMQHVPAYVACAANEMRKASEHGGPLKDAIDELGLGDAESMFAMASLMGLDKMAAEALSGEIAVALCGLPPAGKIAEDPDSISPQDVPLALMIGLRDGAKLDAMIGGFAGQAGLTPMEGGPAGWRSYSIPQSGGVTAAYNDEVLILATTPELLARCCGADGVETLDAPACQYHIRLNLPAVADACAPYADMLVKEIAGELEEGKTMFIPTKEAAFLLDLPSDISAMGAITTTGYYDQGYNVDFGMKTAAFKYGAYYLALLSCMAAQTGVFD
jgi:hypothetical protein